MPLKFLEIAFRSLSSSPACLLCFPRRRTAPRRPPPPRPTPTSPLLHAGTHASPHRPPSSRWSLPGRATHPRRFQSRPGGRHRDAVVERPLQHPRVSSRARPSLWRTPTLYSARSLSDSPLRRPRTPPPLRKTPASSLSPSNPLLRHSSHSIDPTSSFALTSRSSQA